MTQHPGVDPSFAFEPRAEATVSSGLSAGGRPVVDPESPSKTPWDGASVPFPAIGAQEEKQEPAEAAAPVTPPAKEHFPPRKNVAFTPTRLSAFLVSTVIHILLLSLGAGALVAAGVEPPEDPVSVEIVLEAPAKPTPPSQPAQANVAVQHPRPLPKAKTASPAPEKDETLPETAKDEASEADTALPAEQETADQPPVAETEVDRSSPSKDDEAVAVPQPDRSTLSILSVPPFVPAPPAPALPAAPQDAGEKPQTEAEAAQEPEETQQEPAVTPVPHPTPKPAIRKAQEKKTPARKAPASKTYVKKTEERRAKAPPQKERGRQHNGAAPSRSAAASQGEKMAYARKLLARVQRYKRYPAAAQRAGITGAARLSITIDRSGSLRKARLVSSAGSALLDREAMSVAQRAAPYPPPPSGIGKATFSFIVTLRFTR